MCGAFFLQWLSALLGGWIGFSQWWYIFFCVLSKPLSLSSSPGFKGHVKQRRKANSFGYFETEVEFWAGRCHKGEFRRNGGVSRKERIAGSIHLKLLQT